MKRTVGILLTLLLVTGLLFASTPDNVIANSSSTGSGIAGGSWTTGEELDITQSAKTAPEWLQLLSTSGVQLTSARKICHPLRGGQFGWVGEIRQFKGGKWVKLATTNEWVPNTEGQFMSCAQAPSAGTYALFGYYIAPEGLAGAPAYDCSTVTWSSKAGNSIMIGINLDSAVFFGGTITGISEGTTVAYQVTSSNLPGLVGTNGTITTIGGMIIDYNPGISGDGLTSLGVLFTENEHGCSSTSNLIPD